MKILRIVMAGIGGGLAGHGLAGIIFSSGPVRGLLYDPALQSALFIEVTQRRDITLSVAGLILLAVSHSWLFNVLESSMPGTGRSQKGLFWGFCIWLLYWVPQEWFVYRTLLQEPIGLCVLELAILLPASLLQGVVIAWLGPASKAAPASS